MALLQVNFLSETLQRRVPLQVILPVDKKSLDDPIAPDAKPLKTLYLLHGLFGTYVDWVNETRIVKWAMEKRLAVVMPAGENSFYVDPPVDDVLNRNFGEFIGRELVEVTRRMFPLSDKREDTFIGGLSMGGFGAIRNGLKYHQTFSHIIALSAAFHVFAEDKPDTAIDERLTVYMESCLGDLQIAEKSDKNPKYILETLKAKKAFEQIVELPKLYMACGVDDYLITANRIYQKIFEQYNWEHMYIEDKGDHDWEFWDTYIEKALAWLPI